MPEIDNEAWQREKFVAAILVGNCLVCNSSQAMDCEDMPGIDDPTMGFCPDCKTFWCLECGAIFEKGQTVCGHWAICADCDHEEVEDDDGEIIEGDCGVLTTECEEIGKWRWGPDFKKTSRIMEEDSLDENLLPQDLPDEDLLEEDLLDEDLPDELKKRRTVVFEAVDGMVKAGQEPYAGIYKKEMKKHREKERAKEIVGSVFLYHLWYVARTLDGLPTPPDPFIEEYEGGKYKNPPNFRKPK